MDWAEGLVLARVNLADTVEAAQDEREAAEVS